MLKLSLGPLLYYWQRDVTFDFYDAIAATAVDVIYLGETVCSRRHELRLADWLDIAKRLRAAGKEVVLSTQVLLESGAERVYAVEVSLVRREGVYALDEIWNWFPVDTGRTGLKKVAAPFFEQFDHDKSSPGVKVSRVKRVFRELRSR